MKEGEDRLGCSAQAQLQQPRHFMHKNSTKVRDGVRALMTEPADGGGRCILLGRDVPECEGVRLVVCAER